MGDLRKCLDCETEIFYPFLRCSDCVRTATLRSDAIFAEEQSIHRKISELLSRAEKIPVSERAALCDEAQRLVDRLFELHKKERV